jgi:hypothetical protein
VLGNVSTATAPSVAQCQAGDTVLSGGFTAILTGNNIEPRISQPINGDTAWRVQGNAAGFTAVAFCFDNTPPSPP